jgi:subtilisin family serine protease
MPSTLANIRSSGKIRLITVPSAAAGVGLAAGMGVTEATVATGDPPWVAAYEEYERNGGQYVEAELQAPVPVERLQPAPPEALARAVPTCEPRPQKPIAPIGPEKGWHLGPQYSQLALARDLATAANNTLGRPVRIAHIDTGYYKDHASTPTHVLRELSQDFTVDPPRKYADDPGGLGAPLDNQGHGTATLAILAGGPIDLLEGRPLGGAPDAEILPLRVSENVALIGIDALAKAVNYAIDKGCDVITMSMGGVASKLWVDAYNRAYESGVFCVCAAGNHLKLGRIPTTPTGTVYPALFNRVISATGIMADGSPYDLPGTMSGNWGPHDKMRTSIAAYTPNIPWAEWGCPTLVSEDGAGTSSATPQVAAAAALWLHMHGSKFPKDWSRVEAVRQAILQSAKSPGSHYEEFGRGILQAHAAVNIVPTGLTQEAPDVIWHPWLKTITGLGATVQEGPASPVEQMFHVEFAQLTMTDPGLIPLIKPGTMKPSERDRKLVRDYVIEQSTLASPQLKTYLRTGKALSGRAVSEAVPKAEEEAKPAPAGAQPTMLRQHWTPPKPLARRLQVYALDPSYAVEQSTASIATTELEIPWTAELSPGPVDDYLEVIDFDPGSRCFYPPVDLNDRNLLVQNGLRPSPSNPLFHQQMVYAVARKTIDIFERALGRRIFWTGPPLELKFRALSKNLTDDQLRRYSASADDDVFVPRLRIYPHAMKQRNAYYSQRKGALLFGYFDSQDEDRFGCEVVYSCLSYDIVAHETTHAILDGINRTLIRPSNPDVLAFHEAFADIVALLSRFQMKNIVAGQIRATRGDLTSANILGQLGREFGKGAKLYQGLRMYIGRNMEEFERVTRSEPISRYATDDEVARAVKDVESSPAYRRKTVWQRTTPDPRKLGQTPEAHERGAILVAAVYAALMSIYQSRASRLLRLANPGDGTCCCREDLSPELLDLLTDELTKTAAHVLNMCIRAIDYLPPTDITFGDYLRAILTADFDLVKNDRYNYRVAFIEAFRSWGVKVSDDIRNSSEESLLWPCAVVDGYVQETNGLAELLAGFVQADFRFAADRQQSFRVTKLWKAKIRNWLNERFAERPGFDRLLGLDARTRPFYVRALRRVERMGPHGRPLPQAMLQITQTFKLEDGEYLTKGSSLIVNTSTPGIDYVIQKGAPVSEMNVPIGLSEETLRSTYFGGDVTMSEPFAALHNDEEYN